jgi:hypothetical protein
VKRSIFRKPKRKMKKSIASPHSGRRQERPRKFPKRGVRQVSNDHLLRIPDQRGRTANICAGRERDEVWQKGNLPRLITATTSGVSIRQIVSFTNSAERIPEVSVT